MAQVCLVVKWVGGWLVVGERCFPSSSKGKDFIHEFNFSTLLEHNQSRSLFIHHGCVQFLFTIFVCEKMHVPPHDPTLPSRCVLFFQMLVPHPLRHMRWVMRSPRMNHSPPIPMWVALVRRLGNPIPFVNFFAAHGINKFPCCLVIRE